MLFYFFTFIFYPFDAAKEQFTTRLSKFLGAYSDKCLIYYKKKQLTRPFLFSSNIRSLVKRKEPCFISETELLKKMAASYSPALHCSTIGAGGLNFSVRNGKRWDPAAITT